MKKLVMGKGVKDRTGQRFGKLIVKEFVGYDQRGNALWKCKCSCGKEIIVRTGHLQSGNTKSCGCSRIKNIAGIRYDRLIVIKFVGIHQSGNALWRCKCDCGRERIIRGDSLQSGTTRSCGCLQQEIASKAMDKRKGINHPAYVTGKYCDKHTKAIINLREKVRERDNYICQECGKTQEQELKELGRILCVHHIDGDDTNNVKENMITYCKSCHRKLHHRLKRLEKELSMDVVAA